MQCYQRLADPHGRTILQAIAAVRGEAAGDAPPADRYLLDLSVPTLLHLPGIQTTDGALFSEHTALEGLDGKSRVIERHLGGAKAYEKPLRYLTLTYSSEAKRWHGRKWISDGMGRIFDARHWAERRDSYYSLDAKRLGEAIIEEALLGPNGALPPKPQIAQRLSNLTIFADSYGSIFAEQLANVFRDIFSRKFGMDEPEIRDLLKHVVLIGASNIPERNIGTNTFSGVYFEGRADKLIAINRDNFKRPVFAGSPSARQTAMTVLHRAGHLYSKSATLFNMMCDRSYHAAIEGEQLVELQRETAQPYRPAKREIGGIELEPVDRGVVVHFNVPQNIDVLLHDEPPLGRRYANEQRHHSFSYSYPVPGARDHADLLGRICRNTLGRDAGTPDWQKLLSRAHPNPALPAHEARAIERQVSQIVLEQRGRLQRRPPENRAAIASHRERLERQRQSDPSADLQISA